MGIIWFFSYNKFVGGTTTKHKIYCPDQWKHFFSAKNKIKKWGKKKRSSFWVLWSFYRLVSSSSAEDELKLSTSTLSFIFIICLSWCFGCIQSNQRIKILKSCLAFSCGFCLLVLAEQLSRHSFFKSNNKISSVDQKTQEI